MHISREAERSQDSANWRRAVEAVAKRPQLQERITSTIAESIVETLDPHGVMVVVEAEHMCMTMRGVRKPGSKTVTSAVRGTFLKMMPLPVQKYWNILNTRTNKDRGCDK